MFSFLRAFIGFFDEYWVLFWFNVEVTGAWWCLGDWFAKGVGGLGDGRYGYDMGHGLASG